MQATAQCEKWLRVVANLRVDRKYNIAPHKPLLLLVVAELAEQRKLLPSLPLTGELVFRFLAFWTIVANRRSQKPDIRMPFFHLNTDGLWLPLDKENKRATDRRCVITAEIGPGFFACLQDESFRVQMRRVLIAKYFIDAPERAALYDLVGLPVPPDAVVQADAWRYEEARERGREARFRLTVVPAYNYTCALTGYRLVTINAGSIADAAHIHQFADSRNNHPQNGISLCKNAHWLFDEGLWSLDDDYRIIVASSRFHESGDEALLLSRMEGKRIHLPAEKNFWPDKMNISWHRANVFECS